MNTAGGNLPSADGAFERFLTAAIATIITIMFSWRLLTDVSDYDSAGCLLAAPPVGLKHLALNGRHESVDGDNDDDDEEDQSEEEEEEKKKKKRGRRKKKKRTTYKAEGTDNTKNELPGRFHTWGHGDSEDLLDYEACLRIVQQNERIIDNENNTPAGLNVPVSTLSNNNQKRTNNNTVFITYGEQEDKPNNRVHTQVKSASVSCAGDDTISQSRYLQLEHTGSICASEGWLFDEKEETILETDSNINVINCSPLEVKKEGSSIRGGVAVTKANKETPIVPEDVSTPGHHIHNNGLANTNTYWTSPSVLTAMESVSPLQQVLNPPLSTCVQGKSPTLITTTTTTTVTTTTARKSVNVDCPSPSTGTVEKLHESPMTTTPTPSSCSSSLSSSSHSLSPSRRTESGTTSSQIPHHQRDSRPKQPPPPPPPRKPSTSGASNVINSSNNDNRLATSTNIPPKITGTPPILGRRTLSNNNNKTSFANRNNPSAATASTTTTPTTAHPTESCASSSSSTSNSGEVTPSLPSSRVEGGCNREFRDIIEDDNFQQMMIPTQESTSQRTMSMSGFGFRGRYHQPRLPPSYHQPTQHYDSDSDSESESESEVFYFYGLEPIEEEDSDDLSSDSDHSVDYEVKGAFPSSIIFDEHSKVDEDQLPHKRPPPLPPRAGGTTEKNITCARIPQLPVRRKGMSAATPTSHTGRGVLSTTTTKLRLSADSDSDNNNDDDDDSSNDSSSSSDSSPTTSGSYSFIKGSSVISGLPTKSVITTTNYIPEPLPGHGTNSKSRGDHVSLFTVSDRTEDADTSEESCIDSSFASTSSTSSATGSIAERTECNEVQHKQVTAQGEANNPAGFSSVAIIDPSPVIRPPPFLLSKTRTTAAPGSDTTTTSTTTSTTTTAITSDSSEDYTANPDLFEPLRDSHQRIPVVHKPSAKRDQALTKPALPPKPKQSDLTLVARPVGGKRSPPRSQPHKKVIISTPTPVSSSPTPGLTVTARPLSMTVGDLSDTSRDLTTYNEFALLNFTSPERSTRVKDDYVKPVTRAPLLLSSSQSRERSYSDGDVHTEICNIVQGPESHQAPFIEILESIDSSTRDRLISSNDLPDDEFVLAGGRVSQMPSSPIQSSPFYAKGSRAIKMYCDAQRSNAAENTPRGFTFSYTEETRTDYSERNYFLDNNQHETDSINNNTLEEEDADADNNNITDNDNRSNQMEITKSDISGEHSLDINASRESGVNNGNINQESNANNTGDTISIDNDPIISDIINVDNEPKITNNINISNDSVTKSGCNNNNYSEGDGVISDDVVPSDNETTNLATTTMATILDLDKNHITYSPSDMNILNTELLDNGPMILKRELSLNEADTTDTISSWTPDDDLMDGSGRMGELLSSKEDFLEDLPEEEVVPNNVYVLESGNVMRPTLDKEVVPSKEDFLEDLPQEEVVPNNVYVLESGVVMRPPPEKEVVPSKEDLLEDLPQEEVVPNNVHVLESGVVMRPPPEKEVVPSKEDLLEDLPQEEVVPNNVHVLESGMVMRPPPKKEVVPSKEDLLEDLPQDEVVPNNVHVLESGMVMRPPPEKEVVPSKEELLEDLPVEEVVPKKEDFLEDLPEEKLVSNNVCVLESGTVMRPPPVGTTAKADPISTSHDAFSDSYSSGSENRYQVAENEALDSKPSVNNEPEEIVSLSVSNGANNKNGFGDVGGADTIFSRELSNLDIDYEMFKMDCLSHSEDYASVYSLNKLGTCSSEGRLGPCSSEGRLCPSSSEGHLGPCSSEGRLGPKPFTADSSAELDNSNNNNNTTGEDFDQSGPLTGGRTNLSQEEEEEIEDHLTDLDSDRFSPESRIYGSGRHYTSVLQRPLTLHPDQRVESSTGKMPFSRRKINATRNKYFSADNVSDIATINADIGDSVGTKFARHHKATVRALKRRDAAKRLQLHVDTSLIPVQGLSASKSLSQLSQVHSRSKLYSYPEPRLPRPSYHEVHPDCILSPSYADQLEESVRAASIDNLESCISRYGSIASLVETDLDTGETVERHFSFDFDVFEIPFSFQRSYFGKSASMMDLHSGQQQPQQQVRHSTGRGRFADRHVPKSKSMQALETNLDDDDEDDLLGESTFRRVPSVHELRVSRSLQKLNVPDWYKKSSVSRSGSCILNRDTDSMRSYDWRFTPSLTSSPASSIISHNAPIVIKTRVTPAYSRSLTTPMKAPKLTLPPKPANVSLPSDKFRTKEKPKGLMPIPIVPFSQIRDMFESKSRQTEPPSPSSSTASIKTTPIKTAKPEQPKRITPIKRSEHEVTPQPKKSPISQGFSPALRIEEAIEETNEEEEEEEEEEGEEETESIESGRNGFPAAHEFETIKADTTLDVSADHIITNGDSRTKEQLELGALLVKEGDEYRIVEEAPPMIRKPIARRAVPSEEQPEPSSKKGSPQVPPKPSTAKPVREVVEEPVEISRREELAAATPIKTVKVSDRIMQYDSSKTSEKKEKEKDKERDWKPKLFHFRDSSKQAKASAKQTPPQPPPRPKLTVPFFRSRKGKSDGASLNHHSPSHSLNDPNSSTNPSSISSNSPSSNNNNNNSSPRHISSSSSSNTCTSFCNRSSSSNEPITSLSNTNQLSCNKTISTSVPHTNTTIISDSPLTNSSILHSNVVSHNNNNSSSSSSNNNNNNNRNSVLENPDECSSEKKLFFEFLQKPQYDRHVGLPARPTSMEQNQSTLGQPNNDLSFRSPSQYSHHHHHHHHQQQLTLGNKRLDSSPSSRPPSTTPSKHHHDQHYPSSQRHSFSSSPSSFGWTTDQEGGSPANLAGARGYTTAESASTASLSRTDDLATKEASLDEVLESLLALRN